MQKKHQHIVPMFPLNSIVLPGEELPLYIFEPRYKQLLNEVLDKGIVFGIPFVRYGRVSKFGTLVMLKKVFDTKDTGEMNIAVIGLNTFKIASFYDEFPGKLYPGAELIQDFPHDSLADPKDLEKTQLELLNFQQKLNKDLEKDAQVALNNSFEFAKLLDLSVEHKYNLIIKPTEEERLRYIREYLVLNAAIIAQEENLQNRFIMN
ncbi:MAG: LON peptidase substrate-binding domain-containing protein [Flavobacteriales bacterium]